MFAWELDWLLAQWLVFLVEVQRNTSPASAWGYCTAVRSKIDDHVGFNTSEASPSSSLAKAYKSLAKLYGNRKRNRSALVQQHLLEWARVLDFSLHQHRLFFTVAIITVMTASRFSDFAPHTIASFDPALDATLSDVHWERNRAFIRFTDHKTSSKGDWAPKPMPKPDITFPLSSASGVVLRNWRQLSRFTGTDLPDFLLLSPYFHLRRLLALQPPSATPADRRPLFERFDGKPAAYGWYYSSMKAVAAQCGHKYISPHSGRKGGIVAATETDLATSHDMRCMANMRSENTLNIYSERSVMRTERIMTAMASSSHTAVMCERAFGGSDFAGPNGGDTRRGK
jgi:hypothetical protein